MSDEELIRKFYYGSYKINSRGYFACPLYDESKSEDDETCQFVVQNPDDSLTTEEFERFWSHVQNDHGDTYREILKMCRSKFSNISKMNQCDKTFEIIASTFGNLNKLVATWGNTDINNGEFIGKFKSELVSLEKQVVEIVKPIVKTTTSSTSLTKL